MQSNITPLTPEELERVVKQLCDGNPEEVEKLLEFQKWNWIFYNDRATELHGQKEYLARAKAKFSAQVEKGTFELEEGGQSRMVRERSLKSSSDDIEKREASLKGDFDQLTTLDRLLKRYKL